MDDLDDVVLLCVAELETFLRQIYDSISYLPTANHDVDDIVIKCEKLLNAVLILAEVDDNLSDEMMNGLDAVYDNIEGIIASLYFEGDRSTHDVAAIPTQGKGRPKLTVSRKQLRFLLDANFRQNDIASLLRCSTKTISRRMKEFDLTMQGTQITDNDLDDITVEYVKRFPNAGQKSYIAFLSQQGLHIPREMVRNS